MAISLCAVFSKFRLVPADGRLVQIDEHLFRLQIFFHSPWTKFAAESRLLVPAPWRFNISWLHVIDPDDPGAQRLYDAERFVDVARPHGSRKPVWRVVGDSNCIRFAFERDHRGHRPKNFFARNARSIVHIVKNGRLNIETLSELLWPASADSRLGFLFSYFEIRADAVVLLLADQRSHLGIAIHGRTKLDALGFFCHRFYEFRVNLFLHQDAAARRTNFSLIDEHTEKCAIHSGFPIGVSKKYVWRLAAKFERHAFQRIGGTLHNDFPHRCASGERNFVHAWMRDQRRTGRLAKSVHNVDDSRRQSRF